MSLKKYKASINFIIDNILESMQNGKEEIFDVTEEINKENNKFQKDISKTKNLISIYTDEVENLKKREIQSREKLLLVSSDFEKYTHEDIKDAYEEAFEVQKNLIAKKAEISTVLQKLEDLEKNVEQNNILISKADKLLNKLETISSYMKYDFSNEDDNDSGNKWIIFQEKEKSRIARDIHDGPAQTMASIVMKSDIIKKLIEKNTPSITIYKEIDQMKTQIRNSIKEIRRIMYDLRPTSLDELGLIPSIQGLIAKIKETQNIDFNLENENIGEIKSSTIKIICFRIVQESLNNIVKHSKASKVDISISIDFENILIKIEDNGVGFDTDSINSANSFGLSSLKERVYLVDGSVDISSKINNGTSIKIKISNKEDTYA